MIVYLLHHYSNNKTKYSEQFFHYDFVPMLVPRMKEQQDDED